MKTEDVKPNKILRGPLFPERGELMMPPFCCPTNQRSLHSLQLPLDSTTQISVFSYQFRSIWIYLLPARHAGNGLGRGYFFTTDWIWIDRATYDACLDARHYSPQTENV